MFKKFSLNFEMYLGFGAMSERIIKGLNAMQEGKRVDNR